MSAQLCRSFSQGVQDGWLPTQTGPWPNYEASQHSIAHSVEMSLAVTQTQQNWALTESKFSELRSCSQSPSDSGPPHACAAKCLLQTLQVNRGSACWQHPGTDLCYYAFRFQLEASGLGPGYSSVLQHRGSTGQRCNCRRCGSSRTPAHPAQLWSTCMLRQDKAICQRSRQSGMTSLGRTPTTSYAWRQSPGFGTGSRQVPWQPTRTTFSFCGGLASSILHALCGGQLNPK